ncbi:MAG: hypothetical protein AB1750_12940 [Chloroflexota bacterium]
MNWRRVGFLIAVGFLALVVLDLNARIEGLNGLNEERAAVAAQATEAMQTHTALETQAAYATSVQAAEDYARANGLIREGEIPVAPVGDANPTPTPLASPTPTPVPPSNWEIWWNLFFGE